MIAFIVGFLVSLACSLVLTPLTIRVVDRLHYGQFIRQDGPQSHLTKRGTPSMGGVAIILSIVIGWFAAALWNHATMGSPFSVNAMLVLLVMVAMGALGFVDDFAKVRKRQSEGLTVRGKFIGQVLIATAFAVLVVCMPQDGGRGAVQAGITWIENPVLSFESLPRVLGVVLYVLWVNFLLAAWTNAFNLTDGLDGLCTGNSMIAFAAYAFIAFWETNHLAGHAADGFLYQVSDPFDLAVIAGCAFAACFGFLWYNSNPATIFMGDTGSLALGGLFSALSIATRTELLGAIIGGLFVIEVVSDIIQVGVFSMTKRRTGKGRRVFLMAPLHHHFELKGWSESKVVVRFWMVEVMFAVLGVLIFYADWLMSSGF